LLAGLAGRDPQQPPGQDFEPPDEWGLPVEWLEAFPPQGACCWSAAAGRLRLSHPAGFVLLDLRLEPDDPASQVRREVEAYGSAVKELTTLGADAAGTAALAESLASPLDRWLGWLLPYVQARLRRALGLDLTGLQDLSGLAPYWKQRARVLVTPSHVDVIMALAELPIEIRLAGLDRDPGWVPAAGRFIAFHFE
jgi:hypothetical protein